MPPRDRGATSTQSILTCTADTRDQVSCVLLHTTTEDSQCLEGQHGFAFAVFIKEYFEFGIISTVCC